MAKSTSNTAMLEAATTQKILLSKDYLDHLKKVNDVFYDQAKIADQKAAYIFTFMVAVLITSAEGRNIFQMHRYMEVALPVVVFSAIMMAASAVALVSSILVVLPRRAKGSTSLFWGGWQKHRHEFTTAAETDDSHYLFNEYLSNIDNLAVIATAKYRFVTLAFRALLVMALAYLALLALT
ncbi:MAG TPA: Pycsar system effector family protein [Mesorhizobium sp.]|jgi:hypothetical protein